MERIQIGDRTIRTHAFGEGIGLPVVYCLMGDDLDTQLPEVAGALQPALDAGDVRPFRITWCAPVDWNRDYTPWPAPPLFKKEAPFAGQAQGTLDFLRTAWMPQVQAAHGSPDTAQARALLGYSLGGLCALWMLHECALFGAGASCSGSLWYDGWDAYLQAHTVQAEGSRVYLSLGQAEERARNPRMAAVGDATRATHQKLSSDANVAETTLQWHEGGHFADVPARVAQALAWLMRA